ncbi:MAG: hypothetical protein AAGD07_10835 [Planctomycetota bacterium]
MTNVVLPRRRLFFLTTIAILHCLVRSGNSQEVSHGFGNQSVAANDQLIDRRGESETAGFGDTEATRPKTVDRTLELSKPSGTSGLPSDSPVSLWRSGETVQLNLPSDLGPCSGTRIRLVESKRRKVVLTSSVDDGGHTVIANHVPPGVYALQLLSNTPNDDVRWRKWLSATRLVSKPQLVGHAWPVVVLPPKTVATSGDANEQRRIDPPAGPMIRLSAPKGIDGSGRAEDRSWDLWDWNEDRIAINAAQADLAERLNSLTSDIHKLRSLGVKHCILPLNDFNAATHSTSDQRSASYFGTASHFQASIAWVIGQAEQAGLRVWLETTPSGRSVRSLQDHVSRQGQPTWHDSAAFAGFCVPGNFLESPKNLPGTSQAVVPEAGAEAESIPISSSSLGGQANAPIVQLADQYPNARFVVYDDDPLDANSRTMPQLKVGIDGVVPDSTYVCRIKRVGGPHEIDRELSQSGTSTGCVWLRTPDDEVEAVSPFLADRVRGLLLRSLTFQSEPGASAMPFVILDSKLLADTTFAEFCQRFAWMSHQVDEGLQQHPTDWISETISSATPDTNAMQEPGRTLTACRVLCRTKENQDHLWVINQAPWTIRMHLAVSGDANWLSDSVIHGDEFQASVPCEQPDDTPLGPVLEVPPHADVMLCSSAPLEGSFRFRVDAPSAEVAQQIQEDVTLVVDNLGLIDSLDWSSRRSRADDPSSSDDTSPWRELSAVVPRAAFAMGKSPPSRSDQSVSAPSQLIFASAAVAVPPPHPWDTSQLNLDFEEHGSFGFHGWMQSQFPVESVRIEERFAFRGQRCLRLSGGTSSSADESEQDGNRNGAWLISQSFACPASGRLLLTMGTRAGQAAPQPSLVGSENGSVETDNPFASIKVAIECSSPAGIRSASTRVKVPLDGNWHHDLVKLEITKLNPRQDRELRIVIDNTGDADVWIDGLEIKDFFACRQERLDLQRQAYTSVQGLQRGHFSAASALLSNPWAGALIRDATAPPAKTDNSIGSPRAKPSWSVVGHKTRTNKRPGGGRTATARLPHEKAPPKDNQQSEQELDATDRDDQPSVADRLRSWLPSPLRF